MGNVTQGISAVRQPQFSFSYSAGSLSQATTGTLLASGISGLERRVMPATGSVYGLVGSYSADLTAGTVTLTPAINGVPIVALQVTNKTANAKGIHKLAPARIAGFKENDTLSIIYTTSGLNSAGGALVVDVFTFFEDIDL